MPTQDAIIGKQMASAVKELYTLIGMENARRPLMDNASKQEIERAGE